MKKFSFLTSVAVFGVMSAPAIADIANNAESATCNSDTIGVSSGSTILEALWTAQSKNCDAGQYLNAGTANCTTCPTGSYCAGGTYTYNGSNIGITDACPTNYNSDEGASAQTDCYRACTTDDVAHSTEVSGRYYYGDNNQCAPTSCAKGYTPVDFSNLDYANMNVATSAAIYGYNRGSFREMTFNNASRQGQSYYGITTKGEWAADFSDFGTVRGTGICSTISGTNDGYPTYANPTAFANLADETGQDGAKYCYCNITGYRPEGSSLWTRLSSSWVFRDVNDVSGCASNCAYNCSELVSYLGSRFRSALFGAVSPMTASCSINTYSCAAGTYLDNASETCIECPAGSYCAGGSFTYNGSDQGITGTCPSEYALSNAWAKSVNDCYRSCETTDVANALAVSGKYFYGDNNKCGATSCATGYSIKAGADFSNLDYANMNITTSAAVYGSNGSFNEVTHGVSTKGKSYYGIKTTGEWAADFSDFGTVRGMGICSTISGTNDGYPIYANPTTFTNLADETGQDGAQYCYCNMTGYRATEESSWTSLSSSWVFSNDQGSASYCAYNCALSCAARVGDYAGFRSALFGSVSAPSCEANTITIDWYNLGTLLQTNSCTYGQSDIVIPETPSRTGYDFGGWKVNNTEPK